jgi:hypothetical protein
LALTSPLPSSLWSSQLVTPQSDGNTRFTMDGSQTYGQWTWKKEIAPHQWKDSLEFTCDTISPWALYHQAHHLHVYGGSITGEQPDVRSRNLRKIRTHGGTINRHVESLPCWNERIILSAMSSALRRVPICVHHQPEEESIETREKNVGRVVGLICVARRCSLISHTSRTQGMEPPPITAERSW